MNVERSNAATQIRPDAAEQPVVVLDEVSLAFDDKVVLKEVSFTLLPGHTKVILGASGSGKSTILKLILGLLKPDGGTIFVNGERVDTMDELQLIKMRTDLGMVFQEGALFDSLTVAENVGYKLYEESDTPLDDVRARVEEVLGFVGLGEYIERMPSGSRAASAAAWRSRGRWPRSRASSCTTKPRPGSIRSRPSPWTRRW